MNKSKEIFIIILKREEIEKIENDLLKSRKLDYTKLLQQINIERIS